MSIFANRPQNYKIFFSFSSISAYFSLFFYRYRMSPFKVEPIAEWPVREQENFSRIQDFIKALDVSRLKTFSSSVEVLQELLSFTDSLYRKPQAAAFSLSLSEILKAQQILISRSQSKFDEEFPFMNFFNIRDFLFANRIYSIYLKFFLAFRSLNCCVNPFSGTVMESRIRLNRNLLQSLLENFLFSGEIFLLHLIVFNLMEIYSGHLFFPDEGLPLDALFSGGTDVQRNSVSSALLDILDQKLYIQVDSSQETSYFQKLFHLGNDSESRWKKLKVQIDQCDLVLFIAPERSDASETVKFQDVLTRTESFFDSLEAPPLVVLIVPSSETSLPCSGKFHVIPWQNDEGSSFQELLKPLIEQNRQKILVRQTFRFIRDYKEKYGR